MPVPDLIDGLLTAVKRHVPVPIHKETELRDALAEALAGPFVDDQDLTAEDLNRLHHRLQEVAALALAVPTPQKWEFSRRGWGEAPLEATYGAIVRLPWIGAVLAIGIWAAHRSGVAFSHGPWGTWLVAVGLIGLIDALFGTVRGSLRPRRAPPRWLVLAGPRGLEIVFRRPGGQVAVARPGGYTLKTSLLGRVCGLEWAVVDPKLAPFATPRLSKERLEEGSPSDRVPTCWARTIWEITGLLACGLGAGLAVARATTPGFGGSDDWVLRGVFVTVLAMFSIAKLVTSMVDH